MANILIAALFWLRTFEPCSDFLREGLQAGLAGGLWGLGVKADALVDFEGFLEIRFRDAVSGEAAQPGGESDARRARAENAAGLLFEVMQRCDTLRRDGVPCGVLGD